MSEILLSIITVNLNNGAGLKQTIESVIQQTNVNFEFIIIDGGSIDDSINIIREFESKITYWISEPDSGIYHAMNKGIRKARGRYCQFLNSGDYLVSSGVINEILNILDDFSIYIGNMLKIMPSGKTYRDASCKGNYTMLTFFKGAINHSPAFIKRSLFDKYGLYDEKYKIVSDWKWYMETIILHNEQVKYINLDVAYFEMNGISNTNPLLVKDERRRILIDTLPPGILADYEANWLNIDRANRINRFRITRWLFYLTDRTIFKLGKWNILI